jgi:hypothetical protein
VSCADAPHDMHPGLDEDLEVGVGTHAPIGHEHVTWSSGRMDRLPVGKIVGEGRAH